MKLVATLVFVFIATLTQPVYAADEKAVSEEKSTSKIAGKLSFEEGTFLGNANASFMKLVERIETWRLAQKEKTDASLDKIETKREDQNDPKGAVKVLTILHIALLAVLLFLFSLQFVFWTALILILIAVIRRLIRFVVGLVRRDHISA